MTIFQASPRAVLPLAPAEREESGQLFEAAMTKWVDAELQNTEALQTRSQLMLLLFKHLRNYGRIEVCSRWWHLLADGYETTTPTEMRCFDSVVAHNPDLKDHCFGVDEHSYHETVES